MPPSLSERKLGAERFPETAFEPALEFGIEKDTSGIAPLSKKSVRRLL